MHIQHNSADEIKIKDISDEIFEKQKTFTMSFKKDNVIKNYVYYYEPIRINV